MRLFIGIDLAPPVRRQLARLVERLRPAAPRLRWSPVENLHITTKFIGEWPRARLEELKAALDPLRARAPIPIAVRGLGWFPNPHAPRVFWAGVEAGAGLAALARDTEAACADLGIQRETRPYAPHLTLARLRPGDPVGALRQAVAALAAADAGEFTAGGFHLYLSEPGPGGSVYTSLGEYGFEIA